MSLLKQLVTQEDHASNLTVVSSRQHLEGIIIIGSQDEGNPFRTELNLTVVKHILCLVKKIENCW